ncbi:MAG: PQQ-dependent sugar dehydrogenase [Phycisphaerae bacterium]
MIARIVFAGLVCASTFSSAIAGTTLTTSLVTSGLVQTVFVTAAPEDYGRVFIVEKPGRIRILRGGQLLATPFLDMTALVIQGSLEAGLLGLAFDPNYAINRHFYVSYNDPARQSIIARFTARADNPDLADPASRMTVLFLSQPGFEHRGGWLGFGPDGNLYASFGDGGGQSDPLNRAQNIELLQGKILRLDVSHDEFPADTNRNYAIPQDNPFVDAAGADEIWAYGMRNPWRCSFDRLTGDLWIGDVGQNTREEISLIPAGSAGGLNFGWRCTEGTFCTGLSGCACNGPTLTPPVYEYTRASGNTVIGGYVYRGCAIPDLVGTYLFGDWINARFWSFRYVNGQVTAFTDRGSQLNPPGAATIRLLSSYGEDAAGELYLCDHVDGEIYKIIPSGVPPALCPCLADIDDDRDVDLSDLARLLAHFGQSGSASRADGDLDQDEDVDLSDLSLLLSRFGLACPA